MSSGIMESLLQVLEWKAFEPMNITVSTLSTTELLLRVHGSGSKHGDSIEKS